MHTLQSFFSIICSVTTIEFRTSDSIYRSFGPVNLAAAASMQFCSLVQQYVSLLKESSRGMMWKLPSKNGLFFEGRIQMLTFGPKFTSIALFLFSLDLVFQKKKIIPQFTGTYIPNICNYEKLKHLLFPCHLCLLKNE